MPRQSLSDQSALSAARRDRLGPRSAVVRPQFAQRSRDLESTVRQFDTELELARNLQQGFLPRQFPNIAGVRFAARIQMADRIGGDCYDVFRLDENAVGFYVADALGHGLPASLMTIYIKKGISPKLIAESGYRILPPDEVLGRLNEELLADHLGANHYVTAAYATLRLNDHAIEFARAGHPYPLVLRASGGVDFLHSEGMVLGVIETQFEAGKARLQPGDRLILHTDGIDAARWNGYPVGLESFQACLLDHRHLSLTEQIDTVFDQLFATGHPDDVTVLGIEIAG